MGANLIGFDTYRYKYDSGSEGDSFVVGLSPRQAKLVIYINPGLQPYQSLMDKLGKHKSSVSCLYINKLEDINLAVIETLISKAYKDMKVKHPDQPDFYVACRTTVRRSLTAEQLRDAR